MRLPRPEAAQALESSSLYRRALARTRTRLETEKECTFRAHSRHLTFMTSLCFFSVDFRPGYQRPGQGRREVAWKPWRPAVACRQEETDAADTLVTQWRGGRARQGRSRLAESTMPGRPLRRTVPGAQGATRPPVGGRDRQCRPLVSLIWSAMSAPAPAQPSLSGRTRGSWPARWPARWRRGKNIDAGPARRAAPSWRLHIGTVKAELKSVMVAPGVACG